MNIKKHKDNKFVPFCSCNTKMREYNIQTLCIERSLCDDDDPNTFNRDGTCSMEEIDGNKKKQSCSGIGCANILLTNETYTELLIMI